MGLGDLVVKRLGLPERSADMREWEELVQRIKRPTYEVSIAVVGKYIDNGDAYISIAESLKHGGIANDARVNLHWIDSENLEREDVERVLGGMDGIVVAGGFGARGVEGKINAVQFAREKKIPYLGL